jgi:hypothetical protein
LVPQKKGDYFNPSKQKGDYINPLFSRTTVFLLLPPNFPVLTKLNLPLLDGKTTLATSSRAIGCVWLGGYLKTRLPGASFEVFGCLYMG